MSIDNDDYGPQTPEEMAADRQRRNNAVNAAITDIRAKCEELRRIMFAYRKVGDNWPNDGSFGLNNAQDRVTEAEMWAVRDISRALR